MINIMPFFGTSFLAAVTAGLGYLMMNPAADTADPPPPVPEAALPAAAVSADEIAILPQARPAIFYTAITERPLFAPTRRPIVVDAEPEPTLSPVPDPTPAPTSLAPPTDLRLSGILGGGSDRSAYLGRGDGAGMWLRVDAQIDGWIISEIGPDWVTLTAGEDSFRLELFE